MILHCKNISKIKQSNAATGYIEITMITFLRTTNKNNGFDNGRCNAFGAHVYIDPSPTPLSLTGNRSIWHIITNLQIRFISASRWHNTSAEYNPIWMTLTYCEIQLRPMYMTLLDRIIFSFEFKHEFVDTADVVFRLLNNLFLHISHQLIFRYYANAPKCWKASTVTFHRKENPMIQKLPDVYWLLTRQMLSTFPRKPFWECSHRHNLFYSFGHHQFYCQQPQPGHLGPHWGQVFQRLINIFQRQSSPLNCCIFLFELNAPVNLPLYDSLLSAFLT